MERRTVLQRIGQGAVIGSSVVVAGCLGEDPSDGETDDGTSGDGGTGDDTSGDGGTDDDTSGDDTTGDGEFESLSFRYGSAHVERQRWDQAGVAAFDEIARRLDEQSNCQIAMDAIISAQVCAETECTENVNTNILATGASSLSNMTPVIPELLGWTVPYIHTTKFAWLESLFTEQTWEQFWVPVARQYNVVPVWTDVPDQRQIWIGAEADFDPSGDITPASIEGLEIRRSASEGTLIPIREWGASPVSLSYGDMVQGLQEGVVDGAEGPAFAFLPLGLGEQVSDVIETNFAGMITLSFANLDWLRGLSGSNRELIGSVTQSVTEDLAENQPTAYSDSLGMAEDPPSDSITAEFDVDVHVLSDDEYSQWRDPLDPRDNRDLYGDLIEPMDGLAGEGFFDSLVEQANDGPETFDEMEIEAWWTDYIDEI